MLRQMAQTYHYHGDLADDEPFIFGAKEDESGYPCVGNGSDSVESRISSKPKDANDSVLKATETTTILLRTSSTRTKQQIRS